MQLKNPDRIIENYGVIAAAVESSLGSLYIMRSSKVVKFCIILVQDLLSFAEKMFELAFKALWTLNIKNENILLKLIVVSFA